MNVKRVTKWGIATVAGVVGAAAATLLGPGEKASRRRHVAVEKGGTIVRREGARVQALMATKKAKRAGKRAGQGRDHDLEQEVAEVLTFAFGEAAASVEVRSRGSNIVLRGEVARLTDIDAYEAQALSVAGVSEVDNLLRLRESLAANH